MNVIARILQETTISQMGRLPAPSLPEDATLREAIELLVRGHRGGVVFVDGENRPLGILSERDVLRRVADSALGDPAEQEKVPAADVMTRDPVTIPRTDSLFRAVQLMNQHGYRRLVIRDDDGKLAGLLATRDVIQFLTDQFPDETVNLPPRLRQEFRTPEGG